MANSWANFPENFSIQPKNFRLSPPEVRPKHQKSTVYKGFSLLSSIYRAFSLRVGNGTMTVSSVVSFSAAVSGASATLTWQNPAQGPYGGVIIRYKEGSYPSSVSDGSQAYKGTGSNSAVNGKSSYTWSAPNTTSGYGYTVTPQTAPSIPGTKRPQRRSPRFRGQRHSQAQRSLRFLRALPLSRYSV